MYDKVVLTDDVSSKVLTVNRKDGVPFLLVVSLYDPEWMMVVLKEFGSIVVQQ